MDMNDLRAEALRRASDDCRFSSGANINYSAAPEVVVTRAKAYLAFLLGTSPAPKPRRKR